MEWSLNLEGIKSCHMMNWAVKLYQSNLINSLKLPVSRCYARAWRTRRDHRGLGLRNSWEATDALTHAQTREHTGITVKQHSRNETTRSPSIWTRMYKYIYRSRQLQLTGWQGEHRRMFTHAHRRARWRLCRTHTGVPRSRVSLRKTCAKMAMENDRGEELGPSLAALRPL